MSTVDAKSTPSPDPRRNLLLAALPEQTFHRISAFLEPVSLRQGEILYRAGDTPSYVYFPLNSVIALLNTMSTGSSTEISVVGREGVTGVSLFMGGSSSSHAVVQNGGVAYRLTSHVFKGEFDQHGELMRLLLRYTQALITQTAQTAVCNRHHSIRQQLCRWLLLSLDRLCSNHMAMTQERIAYMLGVRREGVTEAAGKLQKLGVIEYSRGRITVLDRSKLEQLSCECYEVVRLETERLLPYTCQGFEQSRCGLLSGKRHPPTRNSLVS